MSLKDTSKTMPRVDHNLVREALGAEPAADLHIVSIETGAPDPDVDTCGHCGRLYGDCQREPCEATKSPDEGDVRNARWEKLKAELGPLPKYTDTSGKSLRELALEEERDRLAAEAKALESSVVHWQGEHAKAERRAAQAEAEMARVVATERAKRVEARDEVRVAQVAEDEMATERDAYRNALAAIVRNLPTCQHVACPSPRTMCGPDGWFYCDKHAPGNGSEDIVGGVNPTAIRHALALLSRSR